MELSFSAAINFQGFELPVNDPILLRPMARIEFELNFSIALLVQITGESTSTINSGATTRYPASATP
jgi:hypothetical protein